MKIEVFPVSEEKKKKKPADNDLGFGQYFTDHMFMTKWSKERGWHNPRIKPLQLLLLHPGAKVLHYGQEIFEGMKAFFGGDRCFYLIRPEENIKRFNSSAERMVMPPVDPKLFKEALVKLIKLDFDWIPKTSGCSLYIRPTMIATEPTLGLRPSGEYLFYIILSPGSAYFTDFQPIKIKVEDRDSRAMEGGIGEAKTGGNYAASLLATKQAQKEGYAQVLWLDAKEHKYIEEISAANIFFVYKEKGLITPRLTGTILRGITRDSILKIAPKLNLVEIESKLPINKIIKGIKRGYITEAFICGTAVVITPVGILGYKGEDVEINNNQTGPVAKMLFDKLTAIQYGKEKDPFDWVKTVKF